MMANISLQLTMLAVCARYVHHKCEYVMFGADPSRRIFVKFSLGAFDTKQITCNQSINGRRKFSRFVSFKGFHGDGWIQ